METTTAAMEKPVHGRRAQSSTSAFPIALLQRKCACGGAATNSAQGECEECRKKKLQRRAADWREMNGREMNGREMTGVPPIVEEVLDSSGQPLDSATREFMEPRFGHDFSRVRVHTDHKASQSAKAVNALAYTVGHKVVFAGGQYAPGEKSGQKLLAHELTHVVQQRKMASAAPQSKLEIGPANDSLEQEADHFAEKVAGVSATATAPPPAPPAGSSNGSRPLLQRAAADQSIPATAPKVAAPGLIVDDEVQELADGQMHKTEFLDKLHAEVCNTAESALKPAGRTASGCPFIEKWITRMRGQTSRHVERAIRKYAPESAGANTAADYIPPVGAKVQQGVTRWATTGEVSGVPTELMAEAMGGGILGAIGSAFSGLASGIGGAFSSVGHLFTKANPGGARAADPMAIQAQLNSSTSATPLESGVKTRMESAFGHSFDRVRVHANGRSAQLSSNLNTRAFTVGHDVAFAAGEYQPGTLLGDALIAHELAHVIQQDGGAAGPMAKGATEYNSLEEDADVSAVSAIFSLWSGAKGSLKEIGKNAMPRLRSGLKLQRCGGPDRKLNAGGWTAKQKKDFINKNFPDKDRSFAEKVLQDMLESNELKFFDEESLKAEIAKRMDTVRLLRKAQEPYGVAFDYPENAPQCFPKGAPKQGQINKAARPYWGSVQFDADGYFFELTELGRKDAYKALTLLFTAQSNICDKTLIHCDYLASVIHFRAFADQIGVDEFNGRVKNGTIEMRLAWNGFQGLEDTGWFHSKKSISIREVRPKTQNDLVIGDQVLFFNHRAYDLINAQTRHEWRLENAFLIDRRNKVDYFEGHGSGTHTNHTMLIKLASEYNRVVREAETVIKKTKSSDAKVAAAANADMSANFTNIKPVGGKWNIVGLSWGKNFNEELRRLNETDPEKEPDLPGLRDPNDPSRMYCIKRPSEAPGDSC
jgi:hypothetical protein